MTDEIFLSTDTFGDVSPESMLILENSRYIVRKNEIGRKMTPEEVALAASEATVLIAGTEDLTPLIKTSKSLRMICRVGIGLDGVPLEQCRKLGISVSWTPAAVTMAVAELTICLMLAVTRHVGHVDRNIRDKLWNRPFGQRIEESTVGLIGFGRIGFNVARLLTSFRPQRILVRDIQDRSEQIELLSKAGLKICNTTFDEVIGASNILSLHVPLYSQTKHLMNSKELFGMPNDSVLVNTARGGIVNEDALYEAIASAHLGGAAVDVFENEPYTGPLTTLDNVILTPHLGSCSFDCRAKMEQEAAEEALRFLEGKPLLQEVPVSEHAYQGS